jgi:hypothetical protein
MKGGPRRQASCQESRPDVLALIIETGLVYYGLRYYSPTLGRFINKDPIEEQGGLNLYGFCANNGVNCWDYLGMNVQEADGGGGTKDDDIWRPDPFKVSNKNNEAAPIFTQAELEWMIITGRAVVGGSADKPLFGGSGVLPFVELPKMTVTAVRPRLQPPPTQRPLPVTVTLGDIVGAAGLGAVNFFRGGGEAVIGTIQSTLETVRHPVRTARSTAAGLGMLAGRIVYDRGGIVDDLEAIGNHIINTPEGAQMASRGTGLITAGVLGTIVTGRPGTRVATDLHHTIPRQILRNLPPEVASNPLVRGRAGAPNRWSIPRELHREIHSGGPNGGRYNQFFRDHMPRNPTVDDMLRLREDAVREFGLGPYRPPEP